MAGPGPKPETANQQEQKRKKEHQEKADAKNLQTAEASGMRDVLKKRRSERGTALSKAEKQERERIFDTPFGVAHPHGKADAAEGHLKRWWKGLSQKERDALQNPATVVRLTSIRSRSGSRSVNQRLAEDAGSRLEKRLRDELGVVAKIEKSALGEDVAAHQGRPDHRDKCQDRVTLIDIEPPDEQPPAVTKDQKKPKDTARREPEKKQPEPDEKSREIPDKYRRDYKVSREKATNVLDISLTRIRMGFKRGPGMVLESFRQINDAVRYRHDMEAAKSPHEKLWGVRPMRGFVFEMEKPTFQWRVKSLLRDGGYDTNVMYREYIIHWLRKGAK